MDTITIGKRSYEIPGAWEELRPRQYERLAPLLAMRPASELKDTTALRTAMIYAMLSGRKRIAFRDDLRLVGLFDTAEDANRLQNLLKVVDWIFRQREVRAEIDVEPLVERFKLRKVTYLLPKKNLLDVTVGEWMYIDSYMRAYAKTRQKKYLAGLVAAVCRPEKPQAEQMSEDFDGFPRVRFNPETIHLREKALERAPVYVQHAVIDYCSRAAEWLPKRYPKMFQGGSSDGKSYGWEGTITELADAGAFGTEREVSDVLIHKVCRYMIKKMETMEAAKAPANSLNLI